MLCKVKMKLQIYRSDVALFVALGLVISNMILIPIYKYVNVFFSYFLVNGVDRIW